MSAVQTSEPTSKTRSNTLLVLLLCIVSCIISWQLYQDTHRIVEKFIVAGLQWDTTFDLLQWVLLHVMYHTCSNHHSVSLFHPHPKIRLQALLLLKAIGPTLTPGVSKDCDGIESKYLGWGMRAGPAAPPASCLTLTAIIPRPLSHFSFVCTPTFHKLEITLWGLKWQVYRAP